MNLYELPRRQWREVGPREESDEDVSIGDSRKAEAVSVKGALKPAARDKGGQMALTPRPARGSAQPSTLPSCEMRAGSLPILPDWRPAFSGDSEREHRRWTSLKFCLGSQWKIVLPSKPNGSLVKACAFPLGSEEKLISPLSRCAFVFSFFKWRREMMKEPFYENKSITE